MICHTEPRICEFKEKIEFDQDLERGHLELASDNQ